MRGTVEIRNRSTAVSVRKFDRSCTSQVLILGAALLFSLACTPSLDRGSHDIVSRIERFPWYAPLHGSFVQVVSDGNGVVLQRVESHPNEQFVSAGETCFRMVDDRLNSLLVFVSPERAVETLEELEAQLPPPKKSWKYRVDEFGHRDVIYARWSLPANNGRGLGISFGPATELRVEAVAASLARNLDLEGLWLLEITISPIGAEYVETFTSQIERVEGKVAIANTMAWGALLPDSIQVDERYHEFGIDPAGLHVLRVPEESLVDTKPWNNRLMSVVVYCPMKRVQQLREILSEEAGPAAMEIWEPNQRLEDVVRSHPRRSVWVLTMDDWLSTSASLSVEMRESWASSPAIKKIVDDQNRVAKLVLRPASKVRAARELLSQ